MTVVRALAVWIVLLGMQAGASSRAFSQTQPLVVGLDAEASLRRIAHLFVSGCATPQDLGNFGQQVAQAIQIQTNGTGCYAWLRTIGDIQELQKTSDTQLPDGAVVSFTARHVTSFAFWTIGISRITGRVEVLTVNPGGAIPLNVRVEGGTNPTPQPVPPPPPPPNFEKACEMFRDMCH